MKRIGIVSVLTLALGLLALLSPPAAQAAEQTRTVTYGPFTIPAGTMDTPGMVSKLRLAVNRPCLGCYITSMTPDLVYADGTRATMTNGGTMLHHTVFTSQWRADATCSNSWLGLAGERFFAAGNERTPVRLPTGYGYRVRWYDSWNMLIDLMNHSQETRTVYLKVRFTYRPSWENVKPVRPVWLDIDQCGDSEYPISAGYSDTHRDWSVNVPGRVVSMIGHVHGHGIAVEATNESRGGESICRSTAQLSPTDAHVVLSMSSCTGDPITTLARGETVRLHSEYNSTHAADDVMGIMLAYIHPQ